MMLEKNGHAIFLNSHEIDLFLFLLVVQKGVHMPPPQEKEAHVPTLNELKLLVVIASNKNKQKSNKNLKAMMGATRAQLLKQAIGAMPFT